MDGIFVVLVASVCELLFKQNSVYTDNLIPPTSRDIIAGYKVVSY
jgi:hypothetical protein